MAAGVGVLFAVWGTFIGAGQFSDNSFLTHVATGRLILEDGIPRSDVYSFTAPGVSWTVQSWLASLLYAVAEEVGGNAALHLLVMALTTALAALVWTLTRPAGSLVPRVAVTGLVVAIGSVVWSERPLLIGLVCLAVVLLAGEGRLDPRWLIPVMWIWVNSHGSFPLGLVALGCLALGRRLDDEDPTVELRALAWAAGGTVLGAVSPLGPALLIFPLELLSRQEVLSRIVEWQSPDFAEGWARLFLLEVVVAVVALLRHPRYRTAIPLVVFVAAALLGARNVGIASIVLVPGLAVSLAGLGSIRGDRRSPASAALVVALLVLGTLIAFDSASGPAFDVRRYPEAQIDRLEDAGLLPDEARMVAPDYVGNYLELRFGSDASVFVDDRYDMYPADVPEDYRVLLGGRPEWQDVLDDRQIDLVLWPSEESLSQLLALSPEWVVVEQPEPGSEEAADETGWVVACRRGSPACGRLGAD